MDYGRMRMLSSRPVHMTFNSFGKKMETLTSPQEIELIIVFRRILMVEISSTSTWPLTSAILNNTQCEFPKCHSFTPFKLGLIRLKLNFLSRSLIFFPSIHSLFPFRFSHLIFAIPVPSPVKGETEKPIIFLFNSLLITS